MSTPNLPSSNGDGHRQPPTQAEITQSLLDRFAYIKDRTTQRQRFLMLGKLLSHFRNHLYPEMEVRHQADGSLVVTIPRPAGGQ